jgi:hypothetical protein
MSNGSPSPQPSPPMGARENNRIRRLPASVCLSNEPHFRLEILAGEDSLMTCQYTSFIAGNAKRTARCWCARPNGKGRLARTAVPRSSPRNCRCSRPARPAQLRRMHPVRASRAPAGCAAPENRIRIEAAFARKAVIDYSSGRVEVNFLEF